MIQEVQEWGKEGDCLTAVEPLVVDSGGCGDVQGLVFLWCLTPVEIKGKGDYTEIRRQMQTQAVFGTIFIE